MEFNEFHREWKAKVRITTSAELMRSMYFREDSDSRGFNLLPDFIHDHGEEWAINVAAIFEDRSTLAARLTVTELTKFRMIFERHIFNLSKALFDESYHDTSDERSLFLLYHKVPPVRICSAINKARNASIDLVVSKANGNFGHRELALITAFSTIFTIELNHIMRVYVYFERYNSVDGNEFVVVRPGDDQRQQDYLAPVCNRQMSFPDKNKFGSMELF